MNSHCSEREKIPKEQKELLMCTFHVKGQFDLLEKIFVPDISQQTLESPGIDPGASRMLSERSAI